MTRLYRLLFIITILSAIIFPEKTFAHKRALYSLIIDTDCGVDDFRALTYFLASRDFNINAITSVDGVFSPNEGANYISQLLIKYRHEGIPVGEGINHKASKEYRNHAINQWNKLFPNKTKHIFPAASDIMFSALINNRKQTIIVAMGPLSNIADLLKNQPDISQKIEMILWYSRFSDVPDGYNYNQNKEAYDLIIDMQIPLKLINGGNTNYQGDFLDFCTKIDNSIYAKSFVKFLDGFNNRNLWDDIMPFYLLYPTLFKEKRITERIITVSPAESFIPDILATSILNYDKPDEGVIFNEIPTSGFMLRKDLAEITKDLLITHGYQEFKLAALTSEIHSHLGIYSILGAKAGLRIMEYLHAGLDEVAIISYAGSVPPISCFNDGLQVGTGATIGYGKIDVPKTQNPKPSSIVVYNNRRFKISLKEEVIEKIKSEIMTLVKSYGLDSEMYWSELRKISLNYWMDVCRYNDFEIIEVIE